MTSTKKIFPARVANPAALAVTLIAMLVLPLGLAGQTATAAGQPEREGNNSRGKANELALGSTLTGRAFSRTKKFDTDFFVVRGNRAGRVKLRFTFPKKVRGSAFTVSVLNSKGKTLFSRHLTGKDAKGKWAADAAILTTGDFYIKIAGIKSDHSWNQPYRLAVSLQARAVESESNNSKKTATPLAPGTPITGTTFSSTSKSDPDFFRVPVSGTGLLRLNLTFPRTSSRHGYEVSVISEKNDRQLLRAKAPGSARSASWGKGYDVYVSGPVLVQIKGAKKSPLWGKAYRLRVTLDPTLAEVEANNSRSSATGVPIGSEVRGSLLSGDSGRDVDAYRISLQGKRRVQLDLAFPNGGGGSNVSVRAFTSSGKPIPNTPKTASAWAGDKGKRTLIDSVTGNHIYVAISGTKNSAAWGKTYRLRVYAGINGPDPEITGTAKVGSTLSASTGNWTPSAVRLSYRWFRGQSRIAGATDDAYTATSADKGRQLSVEVTATAPDLATVVARSAARKISG